jgi:hypothetical protein
VVAAGRRVELGGDYLTRHPVLLDELLDARLLEAAPTGPPSAPSSRRRTSTARARHRAADGHDARGPPRPGVPPAGAGPRRPADAWRSSPTTSPSWPTSCSTSPAAVLAQAAKRHRDAPASPSSPTASWAARNSATPPTSTSSSSTTTTTPTRRRTTRAWRSASTPGSPADAGRHPVRDRPAPAPERRIRPAGQLGRGLPPVPDENRPGCGSTRR